MIYILKEYSIGSKCGLKNSDSLIIILTTSSMEGLSSGIFCQHLENIAVTYKQERNRYLIHYNTQLNIFFTIILFFSRQTTSIKNLPVLCRNIYIHFDLIIDFIK